MGRKKTLEALGKDLGSAASEGTKPPTPSPHTHTEVEDGSLNTRFLEHHSITSSPPNKKKVIHLTALTPNFIFKSGLLSSSRHSPWLTCSKTFCSPCPLPQIPLSSVYSFFLVRYYLHGAQYIPYTQFKHFDHELSSFIKCCLFLLKYYIQHKIHAKVDRLRSPYSNKVNVKCAVHLVFQGRIYYESGSFWKAVEAKCLYL